MQVKAVRGEPIGSEPHHHQRGERCGDQPQRRRSATKSPQHGKVNRELVLAETELRRHFPADRILDELPIAFGAQIESAFGIYVLAEFVVFVVFQPFENFLNFHQMIAIIFRFSRCPAVRERLEFSIFTT